MISRVDSKVLRCVLVGLALAACGGGQKKPAAKPAAEDDGARGKAAAEAKPRGDDEVIPLGEEPKPAAEPEAPPEPEASGPRPPSLDLPKEKRDALVREQLGRGQAAQKAKDPDGMIRAALAALDVDESNVEAMVMLAHGNYLKGYDDKVEAVLNIAKKQRAGNSHPILWMLLGLVYDRTSREDLALAAYEKASQLKPDYLAAITNRGGIYLRRKRYADAIKVFEVVVGVHGESAGAHTNLGSAYRGRSADVATQNIQREQLLRRAEAEFKMAIAKDPGYAPAYFNMGILFLDADPYPGLDTLQRLQQAQKFLGDYKRAAGPSGVPVVDEYLAAAQKGIEREQKILLQKRKREAEKKAGGGT